MMKGIGDMMKQAQEMQEKMAELQQQMSAREVEGQAGAGLVKITMTGRHDVKKVDIDPSLLQEDKEMLEDLLAAAVNDAVRRVEEANTESIAALTGGIQMPPGFKMPF